MLLACPQAQWSSVTFPKPTTVQYVVMIRLYSLCLHAGVQLPSFLPQTLAPAMTELPDRLRTAVHDDLGILISREHAENFVDEAWLKKNGSPYKQDKIKGWDNTTRPFLCRRHIVFAAKEIASETGVHVPYGRLPLPAVDEILYELWPRE